MQKDCREQSLPCASRHLHIRVQCPLRNDTTSLNSNEINEIDFFAVCFTPRSGARQHDQRFIPPLEPYRGVGTQ